MLYDFEFGHKVTKVTKIIYGAVDHRIKKIHSGYKNLNDQARSSKPKSVDSEAVLHPASSSQRVSGEFGIS